MLKHILLILVLFLILLVVTDSVNLGLQTQRLTMDDDGKTILLKPGDELLIMLNDNPSTGYTWEMDTDKGGLLEQLGKPEFNPLDDLVGAQGVITLRFRVVSVGEQTHKLVYHRPWEADVEPLDTFEFTVIVE